MGKLLQFRPRNGIVLVEADGLMMDELFTGSNEELDNPVDDGLDQELQTLEEVGDEVNLED